MTTVEILAIAFGFYWLLGTVIFFITDENESFAAFWTMGLVYPALRLLFFPLRLIRRIRIQRWNNQSIKEKRK